MSVVIPAFNEENQIASCLESVSANDYPSFEVIVVDDCSVDKTAEIASRYPVVLVRRESRGGIARARNDGIAVAGGTLIAFTDCDCRPNRDWLTRMVERVYESKASIVAGRVITDFFKVLPPIFAANINLGTEPLSASTSNVIYERSALLAAGSFDPEFKRTSDYDLMLRVMADGHKLAFCDEGVVFHEIEHVGLVGLWKRSAECRYSALLFKRYPGWTRKWLRMKGPFTRLTIALGFVVFCAFLSLVLSLVLNMVEMPLLLIAAFLVYAMAYRRSMIAKGARVTLRRVLLGSMAMLIYSVFAFVWNVRGSIRYRALLL